MSADDFLRAGVEWAALARAIRRAYPAATGSFHETVLSLHREAAWCHLLVRAGRTGSVVARLQAVYGGMFGDRLPHTDGTEVLALANEFFRRYRVAAAMRYPRVFDFPLSLRRPA